MRIITLSLIGLLAIVHFLAVGGQNVARPTTNDLESTILRDIQKALTKFLGSSEIFKLLRKLMEMLQPPEDVNFFLYTHQNPEDPQQLHLYDLDSVTESNFNASLPTRFTIHGWMSDSEQDVNTLIRDAYLSNGPHNVVVLNWVAESVHIYDLSIKHVPRIGQKLAKFIDFLAEHGWVKPENLTLVGHSLGSHIAGIAARSLRSGQIHTIVALDPAQPGFSFENSRQRLRSTDAYYVESIQTTCGTLGYIEPIGKAAFYPNGGVIQPDCGLDLIRSCGHFRSYVYYAEALRNGGFPCMKCNTYADAINMNCGNEFSETVRMGAPGNADMASGAYFVPILPNPPYSYS